MQQRRMDETTGAAERSRELLLQEYTPAAVVVDGRGEIRCCWGAGLQRYVPPHAGAPATNLVHLARRELRAELSATLDAAVRERRAASCREVSLELDGVRVRVDLVVRPLEPTERDPDELFLVVFQELPEAPAAAGLPLDGPTLEQHRHLQQDLAHLQGLLHSTEIAAVLLDREGRIARFTPAATEVFRLADGDVGRPIADLAARIDAGDFTDAVRRVMEKLEPVERTVNHAESGRWLLMRIHPYRIPSDVLAGVVVSFVDVTHLKRVEAALRQAIGEREHAEQTLRDADRRKDRFFALLSHELRNPLAPIRLALQVLEHSADPAAQARAREIIGHQSAHLARLVDDLVDVTRASSGKLQVERRPLDLREVCRATAEDHRALLEGRAVNLRLDLPGDPVLVEGDATRLAQALGNLLQNAAKFTFPGDVVTVALRSSGGWAELHVHDTGIGIDPELLPRLFRAFSQANTTLNRTLGGLGLGLALVKGLVEGHGGSVAVTSAGKGAGTEFTIRIPALEAGARVEEAEATRGPRRRILVVQDDADAAESLEMALELVGHTVWTAADGPGGLERARALVPEVVLCDVALPGLDGFQVARALRAEPKLEDTLLLAVTGYAPGEDEARFHEAGFDGHLTRPVTVEAVEEAISRHATRRG